MGALFPGRQCVERIRTVSAGKHYDSGFVYRSIRNTGELLRGAIWDVEDPGKGQWGYSGNGDSGLRGGARSGDIDEVHICAIRKVLWRSRRGGGGAMHLRHRASRC